MTLEGISWWIFGGFSSDFLFPLQPPAPHIPTPRPPPSHLRELDFGPFRVRLGVLGWVGLGSLRGGSVREKNITELFSLERQGAKSLPEDFQISVWELRGQNPHCKDLVLWVY